MERYDDTKEKISYINSIISSSGSMSFYYKGRKIGHFRPITIKNTNSLKPDFYVAGIFDGQKLYNFYLKFMVSLKQEE